MSLLNINLKPGNVMQKITRDEVPGFFSKSVEICPGVPVLVYENGANLGTVKPGKYTLQSFGDCLSFWSHGETILFPYRDTPIPMDFNSSQYVTKENLVISGSFRISIKITNASLFQSYLMGGRTNYTTQDLVNDCKFIINEAISKSIMQFSITELNNQEASAYLSAAVEQAVTQSLARYGLKFDRVEILSVCHKMYDDIQKKRTELWLYQEGRAVANEQAAYTQAVRQDEIARKEKDNELDLLADNVEIDHTEGQLANERRRIGLRKEYRKMVQTDDFDKIATQTEMEQFLFENDKAKLLREEEKKELLLAFEAEGNEKAHRREAVLCKLDLQIANDYEQLKRDYAYQLQMDSLNKEIELAKRLESEENRKWTTTLEREKVQRATKQLELRDAKEEIRLQQEMELETMLGQQRILEIKMAMQRREQEENFTLEKQRAEWNAEMDKKVADDQLSRLEKINEMNRQQDLFEQKLLIEREQTKTDSDYRALVENHKFELDRLRLMKDFGPNSILAVLTPEQARAHAEIEIAKANAQGKTSETEATVREMTGRNEEIKAAQKTMMDFMRETQAQQSRMFEVAMQAHSNTTSPVYVMGGNQGTYVPQQGMMPSAPTTNKVVICQHCRAEMAPDATYCSKCGKPL